MSHPSRPQSPQANPVEAVLLAIATPSRNKSALPSVTRTLPQGELFHRAIVGRVGKGLRVHCPELTGRDEFGKPLKSNHEHAHILPLDLDSDGHLDHILVWAPMGLGGDAQEAIRSAKRTWTKKTKDDLQVSVVGRGSLSDLWQLPESLSHGVADLLGPETGSTSWVSATPFVAPRFLKKNGKNSLEGQIENELVSRYGAELVSLQILHPNVDGDSNDRHLRRLRHFQHVRTHGGRLPPSDAGFGLRIELAKPVIGPICLGYASHFGLGRFHAVSDSAKKDGN